MDKSNKKPRPVSRDNSGSSFKGNPKSIASVGNAKRPDASGTAAAFIGSSSQSRGASGSTNVQAGRGGKGSRPNSACGPVEGEGSTQPDPDAGRQLVWAGAKVTNTPAVGGTGGPDASGNAAAITGGSVQSRGATDRVSVQMGRGVKGLSPDMVGRPAGGEGSTQPDPNAGRPPVRDEAQQVRKHKKLSGAQRRRLALIRQGAGSVESLPQDEARMPKRLRTEGSGDSVEANNVPKRTKAGSFRDAVAKTRMAIVAEDHPVQTLKAEDIEDIRDLLWDKMVETPEPKPIFVLGNGLSAGALQVVCDGEAAVTWLRTLQGKTIRDGALSLRVVDAKDLPRPIKMAWKRRMPSRKATLTQELDMLRSFNKDLTTAEWKVVDQTVEGVVARSIILMDRASADYIKEQGYNLHAGMDRSYFKLLDDGLRRPVCPPVQIADVVPTTSVLGNVGEPNTDGVDGEEAKSGDSELRGDDPVSSPFSMRSDYLTLGLDELGIASSPAILEDIELLAETGEGGQQH